MPSLRSLSASALALVCLLPGRAALAQETSAAAPSAPPVTAPAAPPSKDELHAAPAQATPDAPSEGALTPPPDADKSQLPSEYISVFNPAFPTPVLPSPVVHRGRRYDAADLSPYFAEGNLALARQELEAGRPGRARDLLEDAGTSLPVRYLRALASLRAEDLRFDDAADEMEALATEYTALRDRCLAHAGLAREQLGQLDRASALLEQVPAGSRLYADARLALARVKERQKDFAGAVAALEPLAKLAAPGWGRDLGAEALMATADLHRKGGNREGERAALIALWSGHPLSPLADQASRRLGRVKLPDEAKVARGENLVEAHRNRAGLDALEPLLAAHPLPSPLGCRAHFSYGKALRKERRHTEAIRILKPMVERCVDERDLRTRALYVLGSSRSIVDSANGAETYEQLVREFPAHPFADDALFYAADLYVKNGRPEPALERLEQLAKGYPNGDFASEGLFKAFWIHRSQGELERALAVLDRIEETFGKADETYDVERARYWRARVLESLGDQEKATALFEKVALDHPATYYGLIARVRLADLAPDRADAIVEKLGARAENPGPWPLFAGPMGDDPHFLAGVELYRMGFTDAAAAELLAVSRANQPAESVRLLVQLLAMSGETRGAHAVARSALRRDLSGPIRPETRAVWEVAYPNAFRPMIEKHCTAAGFDPDLLQALMREESALDPKALSWAGALGLTQLMPSTARQVARNLGLNGVQPRQLLEPDLNIRLGASYLGTLLKRFRGNRALALAGYNAGALAVDRWRPNGEKPLDEWVEEIPIAETRGYVKRVLRTFNTYQLLYGRTPPVKSIEVKPAKSADARAGSGLATSG